MPKQTKTLLEQLREAKLQLMELEEEYVTQLYFETMPEYDPQYKYCYSSSCNTIPHPLQSVDAWLRAVAKHMGMRRVKFGGGYTNAVLVPIPGYEKEVHVDAWIDYVAGKLRKKAIAKLPRKKAIK